MSKFAQSVVAGLIGVGVFAWGGVAFAEAKARTTTKVNINTATEEELEALPGVRPANAKKIIAGRPYASIDDLSKAGVTEGTIKTVRNKVTTGAAIPAAAPAAAPAPKKSRSSHKATTSSAAAPATAPAAAARPATASAPPAATPAASTIASTPAQVPPAKGMVWVNTSTKVFHREGDEWYGKTKQGKFMTEADAIAAGFRAAKGEPKKQN